MEGIVDQTHYVVKPMVRSDVNQRLQPLKADYWIAIVRYQMMGSKISNASIYPLIY